jgi:hypothetical protein
METHSDHLKALAVPKARRGVTADPCVVPLRIALLALLGWTSLQADTLRQFTLRNSDNPSLYGGVFNDGATFSGDFLVDLSQPIQPYLLLTSWDVWTSDSPIMDPMFPNMPIIPGQHYSSNTEGASAQLFTLYTMNTWLDFDEVEFIQGDSALFLELVEPAGLFKGSLVISAGESYAPAWLLGSGVRSRTDWTGSAILLDPTFADGPPGPSGPSAPEPGTRTQTITALLFLASVSGCMASRKRTPTHVM